MSRSALLCCLVSLVVGVPCRTEVITPADVIVLFNGHDLTNFYTFLKGFGKNSDPKKVFTVHDGMLHVSGEVDGGLITEKEYQNYRLTLEYKWGAKTWPPREKWAMDSGVFLHCTGADGVAAGAWPEAFEFQVWQGAVGDLLLIPGKSKRGVTVESEQRGRYLYYKPGAPAHTRASVGKLDMICWYGRDPQRQNVKGFRGKNDVEKPHGEWNRVEAICAGDTLTYIVNGTVVNKATQISHTKGRILLQSEGAEIFFRKVELRPLH